MCICIYIVYTQYLVNHVAFWVPVFVDAVAVDLDKLLEDGGLAAGTLDGELSRIVVVAVDVALVFVIRVIRAKHDRTDAAAKVLQMELFADRGNVRSP